MNALVQRYIVIFCYSGSDKVLFTLCSYCCSNAKTKSKLVKFWQKVNYVERNGVKVKLSKNLKLFTAAQQMKVNCKVEQAPLKLKFGLQFFGIKKKGLIKFKFCKKG